MASSVPIGVDPLFYAQSLFARNRPVDCAAVCTYLLEENPGDKAVWFLKCRALKRQAFVDDLDLEEVGAGDALMDEEHTANAPRPGTSLHRPRTGTADQARRPVGPGGRLATGFMRPASGRPVTSASGGRSKPLKTARASTAMGRRVRLLTASAMASGTAGQFVDVERLDMRKYAGRPALGRALFDYLAYHEGNARKAAELANEAVDRYPRDWWWLARLGKASYQLGLLREAAERFKASLALAPMAVVSLELAKTQLRLDQPAAALATCRAALERAPSDARILVCIARIQEMLGDDDAMASTYKLVLGEEPSHVEALAMLAGRHFYDDQPEVALRYLRRLLQNGAVARSPALLCNVGLAAFAAGQFDLALGPFSQALRVADDDETSSDIWYNVGTVGIAVGDLNLAYQAFRIAATLNTSNALALTNVGVLESRMGKATLARGSYARAARASPHVYEARFNSAVSAFLAGQYETSFGHVTESKCVFPEHPESEVMLAQLHQLFLLI